MHATGKDAAAFSRTLGRDWRSFRRRLARCRRKLGRERVHQARSAGRRLEGSLALAAAVWRRGELPARQKDVLDRLAELGGLRDLQLERQYLRWLSGGTSDCRRLRRALRRREHQMRRRVRRELDRRRLDRNPPRAGRLAAGAFRRVRAELGRSRRRALALFPRSRRLPGDLHAARIALKRYLALTAAAAPCRWRLPADSRRVLEARASALGKIHDYDQFLRRLPRWERKGWIGASAGTRLRTKLGRRRQQALKQLFRRQAPARALAALGAELRG